MGKYFPKLMQTEVFIQTDEHGGGFNCPMLPVSAMAKMDELSECLSKVDNIKDMEAIRQQMIELVKTVMPEPYHGNLVRLDIPKLTELIAYLMYGDAENDDQPKKEPTPAKN